MKSEVDNGLTKVLMYLCIKWWGSPPRTFPFADATTLHTRRARNSNFSKTRCLSCAKHHSLRIT